MNMRDFLKAGHTPSLFCAFLHFDISFMVWVLIGALANSIVPEFELNESQRGLMIALPILGGAFIRIILGLMTDRIGAYKTGVIGLVLTLVPLLLFTLLAKDSPNRPPAKSSKEYGIVMSHADTWWFCLFYSVTFGGFVGLATFLNSFFKVEYDLSPVHAGYFATACVISGSLLR